MISIVTSKKEKKAIKRYPYIGRYNYTSAKGERVLVLFTAPHTGVCITTGVSSDNWAEIHYTPVKEITIKSEV